MSNHCIMFIKFSIPYLTFILIYVLGKLCCYLKVHTHGAVAKVSCMIYIPIPYKAKCS